MIDLKETNPQGTFYSTLANKNRPGSIGRLSFSTLVGDNELPRLSCGVMAQLLGMSYGHGVQLNDCGTTRSRAISAFSDLMSR